MKTLINSLASLLLLLSLNVYAEEDMHHFIFEASFTKEGIEQAIKNPKDRTPNWQKELELLGGNVVGWYYYPGVSRMVAIIQLPSVKAAAVLRYQRQRFHLSKT